MVRPRRQSGGPSAPKPREFQGQWFFKVRITTKVGTPQRETMAGNGEQVAALLFWGGEIIKNGYMGSVDYSEHSKTMCFLSRDNGHDRVVKEVLAAMNAKGEDATSLGALFGKYPKTVPGGKVVYDAIPLTDDRSWNWFLQGASASDRDPVHLYVVAGKGTPEPAVQRTAAANEDTLMTIYVNICDGENSKTIHLYAESTDTAKKLMEQIEDLEGIQGDKMRLYFNGQGIQSGPTLAYYGVQNKSTVDLLRHQCGC